MNASFGYKSTSFPNKSISPVTKKFYPEIVLKGQKQRCAIRPPIEEKVMKEESREIRKSMTAKTRFLNGNEVVSRIREFSRNG